MRMRRREEEGFELPLVPMIDMMLVLLIFFMVATTLKKPELAKKEQVENKLPPQLPIRLPASEIALEAPDENAPVIIGLDVRGNRYFNSNPILLQSLRQQLQRISETNPQQLIRIEADQSVPYSQVIELIELCRMERLNNIGLHTRQAGRYQ